MGKPIPKDTHPWRSPRNNNDGNTEYPTPDEIRGDQYEHESQEEYSQGDGNQGGETTKADNDFGNILYAEDSKGHMSRSDTKDLTGHGLEDLTAEED